MVYTPLTIKAIKIAYKAHEGQYDQSGVPYILHPVHLAEQMTDETTTCIALLHDVLEDTALTLPDLEAEFPREITEQSSCLHTLLPMIIWIMCADFAKIRWLVR